MKILQVFVWFICRLIKFIILILQNLAVIKIDDYINNTTAWEKSAVTDILDRREGVAVVTI